MPHADVWSADARQYIFEKWRATARRYGFREYDGPPLEPLELFTTKSGEEIVGQLYNFIDKGERAVSLRPEMTPTLARMVAAHERNYKKPIKWFAMPQLFRYERQQKGRLREHFQFNADIFGETDRRPTPSCWPCSSTRCGRSVERGGFGHPLEQPQRLAGFLPGVTRRRDREYDFFQVIDKLERARPRRTRGNCRHWAFRSRR